MTTRTTPSARTRFSGRTALVTGGKLRHRPRHRARARRRGRARRRRRAHRGPLDETVTLIEERGGKALSVTADVSRAADWQALVAAAVDRFGSLDVAVNNAGVFRGGTPWPTSRKRTGTRSSTRT